MDTLQITHGAYRLAIAATVMLAFSSPAHAYKCWKNNDGVRECGNTIPPEYAQKSHETINKGGLSIEATERAKTVEELAAERKLQQAADLEKLEQKKREHSDRVLLDTFASADDLELTRDGQIVHLDSQMRLTQSHIDKLQVNLDKMIDRAADVERRGERPSEEMLANIKSVRGQIAENETFIATKKVEQSDIRARFDADIKRFNELKGKR